MKRDSTSNETYLYLCVNRVLSIYSIRDFASDVSFTVCYLSVDV